jgi:hypothetical protein
MADPRTAAKPTDFLDFLRRAIAAPDDATRARIAAEGLAKPDIDADTRFLLLRQLYLARFGERQYRKALALAEEMIAIGGSLVDLAHHDASRVLQALADLPGAIAAQRLAVEVAPPGRRSFHGWSLATLQHFAGDVDGALASLSQALRWSRRDRPLLRAHAAYIQLDAGRAAPALAGTVASLQRARCREGYGQFLLGMLAWHMGDAGRAAMHLRAFLARNAYADEAKAATLREELRRARLVLAKAGGLD